MTLITSKNYLERNRTGEKWNRHKNIISTLWWMIQWQWTHCIRLARRPAFDVVPMAARPVRLWAWVRWTLSGVRAGDRRVLPEALHISSLPLVGYQILNFLTEELLNSLSDKHEKKKKRFGGKIKTLIPISSRKTTAVFSDRVLQYRVTNWNLST